MKQYLTGIMIGLLLAFVIDVYAPWNEPAPEYHIDLINQDTVLIRNVSTGREYIVRPECIVETLENDNL